MQTMQYVSVLQHFNSIKVLFMSCSAVVTNANLLIRISNVWLFSSTQAETRAEFAERSVAKLEKTIDDLEGMNLFHLIFKLWKKLFP